MKRTFYSTTMIPLFLLLFTYQAEGQNKVMSCKILEIISKENVFGHKPKGNTRSVYEYDTLGNLTEKFFKQKGVPNGKKEITQRVILIDTFGFFTPQCSGIYGNSHVEVRSVPLPIDEQKREFKNIYWISNIETGKENALGIGFVSKSSNTFFVYFVSISGNDIKIVKRKSGDF